MKRKIAGKTVATLGIIIAAVLGFYYDAPAARRQPQSTDTRLPKSISDVPSLTTSAPSAPARKFDSATYDVDVVSADQEPPQDPYKLLRSTAGGSRADVASYTEKTAKPESAPAPQQAQGDSPVSPYEDLKANPLAAAQNTPNPSTYFDSVTKPQPTAAE